jgi:hypothetical protein
MEPLFIGVLFVVLFYVVGVHVERRVRQKEENDRGTVDTVPRSDSLPSGQRPSSGS